MISGAFKNESTSPIAHVSYTFITVLRKIEDKVNLKKLLYRAMILGNSYRAKVDIDVATTDGDKVINAIVWAVTENNVVLKGGEFIPIKSIRKINM